MYRHSFQQSYYIFTYIFLHSLNMHKYQLPILDDRNWHLYAYDKIQIFSLRLHRTFPHV